MTIISSCISWIPINWSNHIPNNPYSFSQNDVIKNFHIVKIRFRPVSSIELNIFLPARHQAQSISIKQPRIGCFLRCTLRIDCG